MFKSNLLASFRRDSLHLVGTEGMHYPHARGGFCGRQSTRVMEVDRGAETT